MRFTVQTSTGIDIQLRPARFVTVRERTDSSGRNPETAPSTPVGASLVASVNRQGAVPTATGLLTLPHSSIGVLYARCDDHLAALVFDLGEAEVRAWLDMARLAGHLPVVLDGGDKAKLVRVPLDDDIERLARHARECSPADTADLTTAVLAVVAQFDDGEALASWGVDVARLRHGSVSLLTPTHALGHAGQPVH